MARLSPMSPENPPIVSRYRFVSLSTWKVEYVTCCAKPSASTRSTRSSISLDAAVRRWMLSFPSQKLSLSPKPDLYSDHPLKKSMLPLVLFWMTTLPLDNVTAMGSPPSPKSKMTCPSGVCAILLAFAAPRKTVALLVSDAGLRAIVFLCALERHPIGIPMESAVSMVWTTDSTINIPPFMKTIAEGCLSRCLSGVMCVSVM
mmetsp:Transcript_90531/g.255951  ORF Transcript_90531/g.255951 Transcript_90531/m.255951 type:complete len:202 (+) Transcript_90531:347-952(+)